MLLVFLVFLVFFPSCSPAPPANNLVKIEEGASLEEIIQKAVTVTPSERQYAWQTNEFEAFIHFGVNTFTGREWGTGKEDPAIFNPEELDASQWVRIMKDAGMKLVILTAKHHDGFCLWPSRYTEHSVKSSPWKGGNGDVVGELAEACRDSGIKLGIYLSPADLHEIERTGGFYGNGSEGRKASIPSDPSHRDSVETVLEYQELTDYDVYFMNQLYELLTEYGEISAVWFDGANPKPGTGQAYNRRAWYDLIRELQPGAVISIKGPDVRWCGNEAGRTRSSEWSVIPLPAHPDGYDWPDAQAEDLGSRERLKDAKWLTWYPAETNTSMRYGWFYRDEEQGVKSTEHLLDIWYRSIGGNTVFLLNMTPDRRGLIPDRDAQVLGRMGEILKQSFELNLLGQAGDATFSPHGEGADLSNLVSLSDSDYWIGDEGTEQAEIAFSFKDPVSFNRLVLQEPIRYQGQRIESFVLEAGNGKTWSEISEGTTVGYKSILRFPRVEASGVRIRITSSRVSPALSFAGLYLAPEILAEPVVIRDRDGNVVISCASPDTLLHYTLDGVKPGPSSPVYRGPFPLPEGGLVKVKGFVDEYSRSGDTVSRRFYISPAQWSFTDESADSDERFGPGNAIDGDPETFWLSSWENGSSAPSLTIDLGETLALKGFTYLPRDRTGARGTVLRYRFEISSDGSRWTTIVSDGVFENIRNNPVIQEIRFDRARDGRFIRFTPLEEIGGRKVVTAAEMEVIT